MYEEKIDVRPIISRFTGYYILIALPIITVISMYAPDYVLMLSSGDKFRLACKLIPFFAFGTFFMSLADYTTLQYHLANKTYIDFIIKLVSGISGAVLNFMLIPQYGLIGAGIATFAANFLYFFLSTVIVLPGLGLRYPTATILRMLISFVPFGGLYYLFCNFINIPALIEMITLMVVFYLCYWWLGQTVFKKVKV